MACFIAALFRKLLLSSDADFALRPFKINPSTLQIISPEWRTIPIGERQAGKAARPEIASRGGPPRGKINISVETCRGLLGFVKHPAADAVPGEILAYFRVGHKPVETRDSGKDPSLGAMRASVLLKRTRLKPRTENDNDPAANVEDL